MASLPAIADASPVTSEIISAPSEASTALTIYGVAPPTMFDALKAFSALSPEQKVRLQ